MFQLLIHVLLWWSKGGLRDAGNIHLLNYLYLFTGPTLLFPGTTLLLPDIDGEAVDLRSEYLSFRKDYYTVACLFWLWFLYLAVAFGMLVGLYSAGS